jgi:hypothetical protein
VAQQFFYFPSSHAHNHPLTPTIIQHHGEPILSPIVERWARSNAEGKGGLLGIDERRVKGEAANAKTPRGGEEEGGWPGGWGGGEGRAAQVADRGGMRAGKGPLVNVEGDGLDEVLRERSGAEREEWC